MNRIATLSGIAVVLSLFNTGLVNADQKTWQDLDLPLTQKQFCRVYESNIDALSLAIDSRNDIKVNMALDNIEQDLIALLPDYQFQNWIGKMYSIQQGGEGEVGIELSLQCNLTLATGAKVEGKAQRGMTILPDSRLFRELAKLSHGDYVLMSGSLIDFEESHKRRSFVVDINKMSKY